MGLIYVSITVIVLVILFANRVIDGNKFIGEAQPYFGFLKEPDYEFLLSMRYQGEIDTNKLYGIRIRNAFAVIVMCLMFFLTKLNFIYILLSVIAGYAMFKQAYLKLRKSYRKNLYHINQMLPYYLKSLEILCQHYTVPVALGKSIVSAPEVFKPGLKRLITKIDAGDSSVDPYMDFAKEYPVRDSMRMMRLLYRLGLGSQENKQEQLLMFSRTVSSLQNKMREQKYKDRLENMEKQTMVMLTCTGGGILVLLLIAMLTMFQF